MPVVPGISDVAEYIAKRTRKNTHRLQKSSYGGTHTLQLEDLANVWEECRVPDWDGHNALPVTQEALRNTYTFLEALPFNFPKPTVGAEPDGDITLEWYNSRHRTLSLSISPDDELHYAALLGASSTSGTEPFFGEIPDSILDLIRKVGPC